MTENANRYTRYYSDELPLLLERCFLGNTVGFIHRPFMEKDGKPKKILDIGCGDGAMVYALNAKKLYDPKLIEFYGFDISSIRVEKAKETGLYKELTCCNAEALPYPDNFFDYAISHQVIEHIENEDNAIKEMARVLKQGGKVYLSTVFKDGGWWYHKNPKGKWVLDPTHLREYTKEGQLIDKLEKYFEIESNEKSFNFWAITDFVLKRLGIQGDIYERKKWLKKLRRIKLPILGYYFWELLAWKR